MSQYHVDVILMASLVMAFASLLLAHSEGERYLLVELVDEDQTKPPPAWSNPSLPIPEPPKPQPPAPIVPYAPPSALKQKPYGKPVPTWRPRVELTPIVPYTAPPSLKPKPTWKPTWKPQPTYGKVKKSAYRWIPQAAVRIPGNYNSGAFMANMAVPAGPVAPPRHHQETHHITIQKDYNNHEQRYGPIDSPPYAYSPYY